MAQVTFSPQSQASMPSPLCSSISCLTPSDAMDVGDETALQKLSFNLENLLYPTSDNIFSDAVMYVQGRAVPVHRCILAARCPFFCALFSEEDEQLQSLIPEGTEESSSMIRIDLGELIKRSVNAGKVGYEAFMVVLGFIYSGKLKIPSVTCIDDRCIHEACRPAVDFAVEMFCLSSVFHIQELTTLWEHRLLKMVEKTQVEDVVPILVAAQMHEDMPLQSLCTQVIAVSNLDIIDIEKQLPLQMNEIVALRTKLGLLEREIPSLICEKQSRRIQKALDSDDVELVQLLLKEGRISLDKAYALHYAASYCDPHTMQEVLELGLADPNLRNKRGYTVLHVAAIRRDPSILVALLTKGARPLELTPSGLTALQLLRRQIRRIGYHSNTEAGEKSYKDRLCIEILEQSGKKNPFADAPLFPEVDGKDLFMRLLYLENRVALARMLFPQEAKIVMGIAHLEATSEFTGLGNRKEGVDLNQIPQNHYVSDGSTLPNSYMDETLRTRVQALQKTVEMGKRFFPHCSAILNSFMDDDLSELPGIEKCTPEEQKMKRQRYTELKDILAEAFWKDVAAMDRQKSENSDTHHSSLSLAS